MGPLDIMERRLMKKYNIIMLLLAVFLFACAGGKSVQKMHRDIAAGFKNLNKGTFWYQKGCYQRSLEYFSRAHELFAAADQLSSVAMSMNNIGNVYRSQGDFPGAMLFFEKSFDIYSDINDWHGAVQALANKAAALIDAGMLDEAADVLNTSEGIAQKNGIRFVPLLNNRGVLLVRKKEYQHAEKILRKALAQADPANFSEFATVNYALGNLMHETRRYEEAVNFFKAALAADHSSGFHKGIADDLSAIGLACLGQDKNELNELAVKYLERSIKIYALMGNEKKVHAIMEYLDLAAEKGKVNIDLTKHFVKTWLEDKAFENPCR